MSRPFRQVDVFTDRLLSGNPVAVVHDADGLGDHELEAGGIPKADGQVIQECGAVPAADVGHLAAGLGVAPEQVVDAQWVDNGPGWVGLLLDSAQTVLGIRPDPAALGDFPEIGVIGPAADESGFDFEVRAFLVDQDGGLIEDPVTGSLNASLGQWLIGSGRAPDSYVVRQGTRRARRGQVYVEQVDGQVWVGGETVVGVTGVVEL